MDHAQARAGRAAVEVELDEFPIDGTLDQPVAELLHQGSHLPQVFA